MKAFSATMLRKAEAFRDQAGSVEEYRRVLIAVMALRGHGAREIAAVLGLSPAAVYKWIARLEERGLAGLVPGARSGRPPKVTPQFLQELRSVILRSPEELGYQRRTWTLALLRDHLAEETGLRISLEHLRRLLRSAPPGQA